MRRRRSHWGWGLAAGGLCLLAMLCLRVECADPAADAPAPFAPPGAQYRLAPLPSASDGAAEAPRADSHPEGPRAPRADGASPLPRLRVARDANGCVLRTARYVRSAYLTFRQEDACG